MPDCCWGLPRIISPFVVSINGTTEHDAVLFLCSLVERLSSCWDRSYGEEVAGVRHDYIFAVIRTTDVYLREPHVVYSMIMELDSLLLCIFTFKSFE